MNGFKQRVIPNAAKRNEESFETRDSSSPDIGSVGMTPGAERFRTAFGMTPGAEGFLIAFRTTPQPKTVMGRQDGNTPPDNCSESIFPGFRTGICTLVAGFFEGVENGGPPVFFSISFGFKGFPLQE